MQKIQTWISDYRTVHVGTIQGGSGNNENFETDDDVLSDEETVKIYPVQGAKQHLEEKTEKSKSKRTANECQASPLKPTKPKKRKTEFCFTTRDY